MFQSRLCSAALVLIAALLLPWFAPETAPARELEQGTDRYGSDLACFVGVATATECRGRCDGERKCRAFTWVKPGVRGPKGICCLKHSIPPATPSDCCVSGLGANAGDGAAADAKPVGDREACSARHPDAIAACTRLLDARGKSAPAERAHWLTERANARSLKDQRQLALDDYAKAIETDPGFVRAYRARGTLLHKSREYDAAIADFSRAIELEPNVAGTYNARGLAFEKKGDRVRAIEDYSRSLELEPNSDVVLYNRGLSLRQSGQVDRAIADYDRAIAINPKDADYFVSRGTAFSYKGDFARALSDHDEAIRLDPSNATARRVRAQTLMLRGDLDRALPDLEEAIRLAPQAADAFNLRGYVRRQQGDLGGALADFDEALRINPRLAAAFSNRGEARRLKGDLDGAIADLDEALRAMPTASPTLTSRGQALAAKGDLARARDDFKAALAAPAQRYFSDQWRATAQAHLAAIEAGGPLPAAAAPPTSASAAAAVETPRVSGPPPAPAPGSRLALVIGNGAYRYATALPNPPNDAADLARSLRRIGFEVVEGIDLDKQGMEQKIREFGRKLERADLALFFYAGHGLQVADKNYLVPVDAKLERQGDLAFDTVTVDDVLAHMESERRVNLVFLDACRDNPLARSFSSTLGARSTSVGAGLAPIQSAVGTMIVYATQPKNVALDGEGRNSPFTAALLKHIGTPGLEISALMKKVRADVFQATRQKQLPWDHSSLIGDVVLAR